MKRKVEVFKKHLHWLVLKTMPLVAFGQLHCALFISVIFGRIIPSRDNIYFKNTVDMSARYRRRYESAEILYILRPKTWGGGGRLESLEA